MERSVLPLARTIVALGAVTLTGLMLLAPSRATAFIKSRMQETTTPQMQVKPEAQFPVNASWTLAEMNGKPVGGDQPTFTLDDKFRATGFAGCNTYSMTLYPGRGQKLLAGAIARTTKTCDKALDLLERTFLVTLHSVPTWQSENAELIIKTASTTLRFRRGL